MKIRPVILCGGAGTRLWPNQENTQAKQFIDFGGWTLLQKAFERINNNSYDFPIISTNLKYLKDVKKTLKKSKIKKYKIIFTGGLAKMFKNSLKLRVKIKSNLTTDGVLKAAMYLNK